MITTWVISYDGNMMIYVIFRKDEWFSPSQNVSSTLCSSECYLALTYYSKIHSESKQIAATVVESKPRKICTCLPISFSFYSRLIILPTIVRNELVFQKNLFQKSFIIHEPNSLSKHLLNVTWKGNTPR